MLFEHKRHIAPILTALLLVMSLVACSSDDDGRGDDSAVVRLAFFAEEKQEGMRSLNASNWSLVNDLAVAIYDNGSNIIGYSRETSPTEVSAGMYTLDVETHKATGCSIYAAANIAEGFFNDGSTLSDIKDKKITRAALTDLANDTEVPMVGVYGSTVNIKAGSQSIGNVQLKRLCSQIALKIIPGTDIIINSYQLCHLPLGTYYVEREPADWTAPAAYADFAEVNASNSTTTVTNSYFVYESLAGFATGLTAETDRYQANAPTEAAYLLVGATGPGWKSVFRIYLGGLDINGTVNHNNFNVYRNCQYTVSVQINGATSTDLRIDKSIEPLSLTTTINPWGDNTPTSGGAK